MEARNSNIIIIVFIVMLHRPWFFCVACEQINFSFFATFETSFFSATTFQLKHVFKMNF